MEIAMMQPYVAAQRFDGPAMERLLLELGDSYDIRVSWQRDAALLAGVCAVAGGLLGNYAGGKLGAAVGAGVAGATGYAVATMVSLREIWSLVKVKLEELLYILFNFLNRLDPVDYLHGYEILMACASSKRELIFTILDFIAQKLGTEVISSISVGMQT